MLRPKTSFIEPRRNALGRMLSPQLDGRTLLPDALVGVGLVNNAQALFDGQPIGITRPVRSAGKLVANFASGNWLSADAITNHTVTQGYTGFDANGNVTGIRSRTGQPQMLRVLCNNSTATNIVLQSPGTNILNAALAGKIGLWVHVENQPGYGPGGTPTGNITVDISTSAFGNHLTIGFNSNQVREGWNFLKFVMRDPVAYQTTSPTTEHHPFGISAACTGNGANANIVANSAANLRIATESLSGATLTFDSFWTAWDVQAQVVLGCDAAGNDLMQLGLPRLQERGLLAYFAVPGRIYSSGSRIMSDFTGLSPNMRALYDAGWDCVNHSVNHHASPFAMGQLTSAAEIDYEVAGVQASYASHQALRGCEFYASPQSSSSRLSDQVIRNRGFRLQRHARKWNVSVTPWGIDNPHHVGAFDLGNAANGGVGTSSGAVAGSIAGSQVFSKIKRQIDVAEAYGDTIFCFWHGLTQLGDTGSGEDLTGDNLVMTASAFNRTLDYMISREAIGGLRVRDAMTGFYYGVGR